MLVLVKEDYKICGIIGAAGTLLKAQDDMFESMLIVDVLRGQDSTGVATIPRYGDDFQIAKSVGDPFQLFERPPYAKAVNRVNKVMIGHNRYATVGHVKRSTAHPFEYGNIIGVHNGTIKNKVDFKKGYTFDVDSQALLNHIDEEGIHDAIAIAKGAYCIVYWNKATERLNFIRNKERPLHLCFSKDRKQLYWASEAWMITVCANRANIDLDGIWELPVDQHYSFSIPETDKAFDNAEIEGIKQKEEVKHHHSHPSFTGAKASSPPPKKALTVVHSAVREEDAKKKTPAFSESYKQFSGATLEFTILDIKTDNWSARYAVLENEDTPLVDFRVYMSAKDDHDLSKHVGRLIRGKVSRPTVSDGILSWKISPDSVELLPVTMDEVLYEASRIDHMGRFITEDEFNSRYNGCAWCGSPVTFEEANEILSEKDCLCPECVQEPDVRQYLPKFAA